MNNDYNGIEEYLNVFDKEYCDEIIRHFKIMETRNITHTNNGIAAQDNRIVFDWAYTSNTYHYDYNLCSFFYEKIHETYLKYVEKYQILKTVDQHSPKGMSVQCTKPHEGYHQWHAEIGNLSSSARVINYMLYLNDIDEGGETEFLYQGIKIKPEYGKVVIFPCSFTHPHRGNPIYKNEKFIITGWYTYDK